MSSFVGEKDRKIIPRWRGFEGSVETSIAGHIEPSVDVSASLQSNIDDWDREQSLWTALDVVGGAIVENRLDLATGALDRLRSDPRTPPAALALVAQNERNLTPSEESQISIQDRCRDQIRVSRRRLSDYPFDPIEWIDLARSFTTLGSLDKAQRCIATGLVLAPSDVFVLRASSRFYIQQQDPERAQHILTKAPRTLKNPWLLASEIAAASSAGRESALLKVATRLEQADFRNEDLTELRAAIATAELDAGSTVKGKKLLRRSLRGANENSLAQVQWMDRTRLGNIIDTSTANVPDEHEAAAWRSFFEGKWGNSAERALTWFKDQPFSVNAGIFCSYILSGPAGLPGQALEVLKIALQANENNLVLRNNLAYTHIQLGQLKDAEAALASIQKIPSSLDYALVQATTGLLEFRKGSLENGRVSYDSAIKIFLEEGGDEHAGRAATFLALEEVRLRTPESPAAVKLAFALTENHKRMDITAKLQELNTEVEHWLQESGKTVIR